MTELLSMALFEYLKPRTVDEAIRLLEKVGGEAKVIAGGTEVVILLKSRLISPKYLIDIGDLREMDFVDFNGEILRIGALTNHRTLAKAPLVRDMAPILSEAASQVGTVQVQNMGTIGGNIVNGSPAADMATPLLAMEAKLKLNGCTGERIVPIDSFFLHVKKTCLQCNELLREIQIPISPPKTGASFIKVGRRMGHELSIVNVAITLTIDGDVCRNVRIALGSVAPTPIRAKRAESFLSGKALKDEAIGEAARIASEDTHPISDVRASADYRRELSRVLVQLAIKRAMERVEGDSCD